MKTHSFKPKVNQLSQPAKDKLSKFASLKLIALGGVGDVTKNMYVYEYQDDIVIIDCGIGFPDEAMLGIDLVIPDISYLRDKKAKIRGIVISHAHDDHIGGLPYIWPELGCPIYAQRLASGFIRAKFSEHHLTKEQIKTINLDTVLELGVFKLSFYRVSHSVPDSTGIIIDTPVGKIIHQADFKLDWTPIDGQVTDVGAVGVAGKQGVLMMLIDSLRVEKQGYSLSEKSIQPTFERIEKETKGKILITTTSSNIHRIQQAINVAVTSNRKVAMIGRSMEGNFQVARDLGYLKVPPGLVIPSEEVKGFPANKLMLIIAGSQGQAGSSLSRAANNDHKVVFLKPEDSVVFSADPIPSTESAQYALIDKLTKLGCNVYYTALTDSLHVSILPDTQVLIKDKEGAVRLQEIQKIDDQVEACSFDRKFCKVSFQKAKKIIHNYSGTTYRIITKSGRSVNVTRSHSLFTLKSGYITEVESQDLKEGDYLLIPKSLPTQITNHEIKISHFIPQNNHYKQKDGYVYWGNHCIGPASFRLSNQLCRFLGYYLAEGSAPRHLSLVFNKSEEDLINEVEGLIKELLKCSLNFETRGNACELTFATPFLGKVFKSWFGEDVRSKQLPNFIFSCSEEQKLSFLGAYINGGGGIDKGTKHSRIRIKTASRKLASGLLYLFSSLGIIAKFDHIQKNPGRFVNTYKLKPTNSYVVRIQGEDYIKKLLPYLSAKFQRYFETYYTERLEETHKQTHSPEAFPILELNLEHEITPKPNTLLSDIWHQVVNKQSLSQLTINPSLISRDAASIGNPLIYYLDGDLLFDPIAKIEIGDYKGLVYDLEVPGNESFLGGFGGIFLHNSGHASSEEIKVMINLAKPKYLMPIGATFRQMKAFSKMAQDLGWSEDKILLNEDGQSIVVTANQAEFGEVVEAKNIYIDGLGIGDVGNVVLRDRKVLSEEGVVLVVVPVDVHTSQVAGEIDVISRGFVFEKHSDELLNKAKEIVKSVLADHPQTVLDWRFVRRHVEENLEQFFYDETQRRPMILVVIAEV